MKKNNSKLFIVFTLMAGANLAGCNDVTLESPAPQPSAIPPTIQSAPLTPPSTIDGGTSTIGNGRKSFSDDHLQLAFSYPTDWKLTQSDHGSEFVYVVNDIKQIDLLIQNNDQSEITEPVHSQSDLRNYLLQNYPGRDWTTYSLIHDRQGFGSEQDAINGTDGQYYFMDASGKLIHLQFWLDQDGSQKEALAAVFDQLEIQPN
jgi:hypothetical protein